MVVMGGHWELGKTARSVLPYVTVCHPMKTRLQMTNSYDRIINLLSTIFSNKGISSIASVRTVSSESITHWAHNLVLTLIYPIPNHSFSLCPNRRRLDTATAGLGLVK